MNFTRNHFEMYNSPFTVDARINSLNGNYGVVDLVGETKYNNQTVFLVNYGGELCTAILNCFNGDFYVDDKYGIVEENCNV